MNIFSIMAGVSRRVEPYHAHFLAEALRASQRGDRRLFDSVWRLAAPDSWDPPKATTIHDEDVLVDGRIDIVLDCDDGHVLGVEVKTTDASCREGQLTRYADGMSRKYPGRSFAIAYLTPFNRARAGNAADRLRSVRAYDDFRQTFEECVHLSWLDVSEIKWAGGDLWLQHQQYVRNEICASRLLDPIVGERARGFIDFFGEESSLAFSEAMSDVVWNDDYIELSSVVDTDTFVSAFRLLIESPRANLTASKSNELGPSFQRSQFLESRFGRIHAGLFALADEYRHVWLRGKKDYGLVVAHPTEAGGVSIANTKGRIDRLRVGQPR